MYRFLLLLLFLALPGLSSAQSQSERFPIFPECNDLPIDELERCFYNTLYTKIRENYEHPGDLQDEAEPIRATIRFEVDQEGRFVPIRVDALDSGIQDAMEEALNNLEPIQPPSFNGSPTYMQFVLNLPTPVPVGGTFERFEDLKEEEENDTRQGFYGKRVNKLDAYAKGDEEYGNIKSLDYQNDELTSGALIPLSRQRYHRYEAAMNRVGTNAHTAVKPYAFNTVNKYYDLEERRQDLMLEKRSWLGRKVYNEHLFEVKGKDYWFVLDPGVDLQLGYDSDNGETTYNNTRMAMVRGGVGSQLTFGASIFESQGFFAGYFNREIRERAPLDGGNPGIVPGHGIAEPFGDNAFDYPRATGYISYQPSKYFNLQLGHGQQFIGDGYRSMIISDNAQPIPYFKATAEFWKLNYTVLYTSLLDVRSQFYEDDTFASKYMTMHYLSWNATERLNVGVFESVLWQNRNGRGFDFNYVNPLIFYQTIELETGSRSGNALLGATAKYKLTDNLTAYGQFTLDELRVSDFLGGTGNYRNKYAGQLGLKYYNAFSVPRLFLRAEYNAVRPYTYSHISTRLNYATSNQALAHPWGANFREIIFTGRYTYGRLYGIGKLMYGQRGYDILSDGDDANYGGDIYRSERDRPFDNNHEIAQGNTSDFIFGQVEAGYLINPASRLKGYVNLIYRSSSPEISNAVVSDESTVWFMVGLRTDIFNWSFDR